MSRESKRKRFLSLKHPCVFMDTRARSRAIPRVICGTSMKTLVQPDHMPTTPGISRHTETYCRFSTKRMIDSSSLLPETKSHLNSIRRCCPLYGRDGRETI